MTISLYVTGFPNFFNENDPGCDMVAFCVCENRKPGTRRQASHHNDYMTLSDIQRYEHSA